MGVTPEEIEAAFTPEKVEEFKEAAERWESWAQYNLGNLYTAGKGVPEDQKEAVCLQAYIRIS